MKFHLSLQKGTFIIKIQLMYDMLIFQVYCGFFNNTIGRYNYMENIFLQIIFLY